MWDKVFTYAVNNKGVLMLVASHVALFGMAVVRTMPKPGSMGTRLTLYTWMYDCLHQYLNIAPPEAPNESLESPK